MMHPHRGDPGATPPDEFLTDMFAETPDTVARDEPKVVADVRPATHAGSEPPPTPARLQRIESQLDTVIALLGKTPPVPEALVDDLKLAKSNLAGLSERVESLERRLSEKFKPIEEAAQAVRETTDALAATGKKLEAWARGNVRELSRLESIEDMLRTLKGYAFWWSAVVVVVAAGIGFGLDERFGLL